MGLPKGRTNNEKGKPAGTLNKMSKELRLQISDFLEENFPKVITEFNSLKGRDKVKLYVDLLPYCLPRLQSSVLTELEALTTEQIDQIIHRLKTELHEQVNQN